MIKIIDAFLTSRISGWLLLIIVIGAGGAAWWLHHNGYKACIQDQQGKAIIKAEKRNEIANNRPDDIRFFDGLLRHIESWR